MLMGSSGSSNLTADGAVGPSGSPIRVYAASINRSTTVSAELQLRNGTSATATLHVSDNNQAGSGLGGVSKTIVFGEEGILFSSGCFYDHNSAFTSVTFQYRVEK